MTGSQYDSKIIDTEKIYLSQTDEMMLENTLLDITEAKKQNIEMLKVIQLTSQELIRLKGNDDFYDNYENATKFIDIVSGKSFISIRLIDHFVTEYSKINKCNYKLIENNKELIFNIHFDYKNQLKYYQKIHFDPFSRGDRIPFFMNDTCIITTIGQLNFFKWFISKKIYDYLFEKKTLVYDNMGKKSKKDKNYNNNQKLYKTKCKPLIEPIKKPLFLMDNLLKNKTIQNIVVSFN
jgi:hypothetical protein